MDHAVATGHITGLLSAPQSINELVKVGLVRQQTGWLTVDEGGALYAPHTESGFRAPANKTLLLLANGLLAKQGLRRARRQAAARATAQ